jgi:hypothetical protein
MMRFRNLDLFAAGINAYAAAHPQAIAAEMRQVLPIRASTSSPCAIG